MPTDSPARRLTKTQWHLVGTALALVSITVILGFLLGVFHIFRSFVTTFAGVLWPLAVAGILSLILRPVVRFLEKRVKLNRVWSIIILYLLVVGVLAAGLALLVPTVIDQTVKLVNYLPDLVQRIQALISESYPTVVSFIEEKFGADALDRIQESIGKSFAALMQASEPAVATVMHFVARTVAVATGLAVVPVYLFFLLGSDRNLTADLKDQLSFVRDDWRDDAVFLVNEFIESIVSFFRGQIIIALIMGALLAIGFTIVDLNFAIVLGLSIGLLNIIPYLGSIIGLSTVIPLAYFQNEGGITLVLLVLGVFVAVQMIEGYVLTPRIMGETTGLHPMVIIVAIFFWGTALNGILGMILAIPLTAFFVVAWRLVKRRYLGKSNRQRRHLSKTPASTG